MCFWELIIIEFCFIKFIFIIEYQCQVNIFPLEVFDFCVLLSSITVSTLLKFSTLCYYHHYVEFVTFNLLYCLLRKLSKGENVNAEKSFLIWKSCHESLTINVCGWAHVCMSFELCAVPCHFLYHENRTNAMKTAFVFSQEDTKERTLCYVRPCKYNTPLFFLDTGLILDQQKTCLYF